MNETLLLLFAFIGSIVPGYIHGNAKYYQIPPDAQRHCWSFEWVESIQGEIKEHKKEVNHKLPWDDCLELEAYIRSDTAQDIYKQDEEEPKTVENMRH